MGMFDDVRCEYPLPDKEAQDLIFQTKDLANLMEEYTITEEGRLILHHLDWEPTPKEELEYPDAEPGTMQSMYGVIRKVGGSERLIDLDYHGMLFFYRGEYEYLAKFTDGKVVLIDRVKHTYLGYEGEAQ